MPLTIIADEDLLNRRVHGQHFRRDGTLSSAAFKRRSKPETEISVDLARLTTIDETIVRGGGATLWGVAQLEAARPRGIGFQVEHAPLPDNESHSLIRGENDDTRCRLLAESCIVVRRPE